MGRGLNRRPLKPHFVPSRQASLTRRPALSVKRQPWV